MSSNSKRDFCVKEHRIVGIFHPSLNISGNDPKNDNRFKIYSNGEIVKHNYHVIDSDGGFFIDAPINRKSHRVEVYYDKTLIYKTHNYLVQRILHKFCQKLNGVAHKCVRILKNTGKEICLLWEDYHLLVPTYIWSEYVKFFKSNTKKSSRQKNYFSPSDGTLDYHAWSIANNKTTKTKKLSYEPLISILIPVYNINREYLSTCLDSILNQTYPNFEVCIADDCSDNPETIKTLQEYEKKDHRIKVVRREENGHISRTTNSAFSIAKGEFVGLMDDDDILTPNALYEIVKVLNQNKDLDFIYSDEDKLDVDGNYYSPHFKPDFSPDLLLGVNYICHFEVFRRELYEKVGGEKHEFVGAQDHDLFLKMTEATDRIHHIPKVLYHWRIVPGSTSDTVENKQYAIQAGQKSIEKALKRRNIKATVTSPRNTTNYLVEYHYRTEPKISIIINATRKKPNHLKDCIKSIREKTTYKNYDITIISAHKHLNDYFGKQGITHIICHKTDNITKINTTAALQAKGEYLLFLDESCTVISEDWLSTMVGYAAQKHVGCVGCKLLYSDNTIHSAGLVLGINDSYAHAFKNYSATEDGLFGRLLVPYNYSAVSRDCLMVSREKFHATHELNPDLGLDASFIDLNLKLLHEHLYNVILPQVELYYHNSKIYPSYYSSQSKKDFLQNLDYLKATWPDEFKNDPFYNPNFSKDNLFFIKKK